jgi:hypothetical protein
MLPASLPDPARGPSVPFLYEGAPDIPVGMTIAAYRRTRVRGRRRSPVRRVALRLRRAA